MPPSSGPAQRRLTARSTLDNLKSEAKRRLKALRASDPDATLRAAQHATALDYGFSGWPALKEAVADLALGRLTPAERADAMLRHCWGGQISAAQRILALHPDVVAHSLPTAIVCGDLAEVRRRLAANSDAARAKDGPLAWEPLLYLAYGRIGLPAAADNAVAIAEALLDAGADPNASFNDGWENPFKVLTGVIGQGEGVRPTHPRAPELVDLLIARGADPFDTQALYDTSIVADDVTWTERLFEASAARGDPGRWREIARGLGGRHAMSALDYLLGNAVSFDHRRRAEWLVAHGADPNGINSYSGQKHHTQALTQGLEPMAALLVRLGAEPERLKPAAAFQLAVRRLDRDAAKAIATAHPKVLESPRALLSAAEEGRADAVALLLELGVSANVRDEGGRTALHAAAGAGALAVARLLIAAGAEIDPRETNYDSTPLGAAVFFGKPEMVRDLAPLSRDVFSMAAGGETVQLAARLSAEPALANARRADGRTPLFHLPDDEDEAAAVVRLLLARGADPKLANDAGITPDRAARDRGLDEAADLMRRG